MNDLQLIRPKQLCKLLNISIATLYNWEKKGELPFNKIQIGPGAVGFRKSDVVEYLDSQEQKNESNTTEAV